MSKPSLRQRGQSGLSAIGVQSSPSRFLSQTEIVQGHILVTAALFAKFRKSLSTGLKAVDVASACGQDGARHLDKHPDIAPTSKIWRGPCSCASRIRRSTGASPLEKAGPPEPTP